MSTRAHVVIKERNDVIKLYRHSDGYPEGCGEDIKKALDAHGWGDPEYFAADLIRQSSSRQFVPALSIHGDEEFFWTLDFDKKELSYQHGQYGKKVLYHMEEN